MKILNIIILNIHFLSLAIAQDIRVVPQEIPDEKKEKSQPVDKSKNGETVEKEANKESENSETVEKEANKESENSETEEDQIAEAPTRNPFATAAGPTNQRLRLARLALNSTRVLGMIHTDLNKFAVIQIDASSPPLILAERTIFSIQSQSNVWIDVEIQEITEFDVRITPTGSSDAIIIR